ncbi:MAG: LysR family transcriptional regulator, partial [Pseudomonadota bacterium]
LSNLASVDLNLLKVLDQVAHHGSVTAAAKSLGVGQPAVSQALSRLRLTFQDELFTRGPGGLVPTPRTEAIIGPIRTSLGQIEQSVFGPQQFEPASTATRYFIGASDYAATLFVPAIMQALRAHMPAANLSIRRADKSNAMDMLASGDIDLAIGMFPETQAFVRRRTLFTDRHLCVYNPALVQLPDPLQLADYVAHDHMLVSLDGSPVGFVDSLLKQHGLQRRVAVTTPYFLQSAYLLESLPLIATLPERFVHECSTLSSMATRPLPVEGPGFDVSLAWRAGDDRNPRIAALTSLIIQATEA